MSFDSIIIQVDKDLEYPNPSLCAAATGFRDLGFVVTKLPPLEIAKLAPTPKQLVFGGVEVVRPYLKKLGCEPPPVDYPKTLEPYLGRRVCLSTLGAVRRGFNTNPSAQFIKPREHKLFSGFVVERFSQLAALAPFPQETEIYVSEVVPFLSEWRCYVLEAEVVGVGHYLGDPLLFPDREIITHASQNGDPGLVSYSLDFGITRDGRTLLVEANDLISLGAYGIKPTLYAKLIEARWSQIVGTRV